MPPTGVPPSVVPSVEDVIASLGCYSVEAYAFIQAGIHLASEKVHGEAKGAEQGSRHVSGRQLCETLRDLAIARWGMMASTVLRLWGLNCTMDFGKLVFAFVDAGIWQKQPSDSIEDFNAVYQFRDVFDQRFKITLPEKVG